MSYDRAAFRGDYKSIRVPLRNFSCLFCDINDNSTFFFDNFSKAEPSAQNVMIFLKNTRMKVSITKSCSSEENNLFRTL